MKLLICFLLFPILLFAQNDFEKYPLKGKIKLYTTTKFSGDTLKPKEEIIERIKYDSKGRLSSAFRSGGGSEVELSDELRVYKRNMVTAYHCLCNSVGEFSKSFSIQTSPEPNKTPRLAVNAKPQKFVAVTQLDGYGNAVLVSNYSEEGYKTSQVITAYNRANKPVTVEKYNSQGFITETLANTYDKAGLLVKQVMKRNLEPVYKYNWVYEDGTIKEVITYRDDVLYDHTIYTNAKKEGYTEFGTRDAVQDIATVKKHVYYDDAGREVKVINLNQYGIQQSRDEYKYDEKGNLKTYSIYDKDNVLNTKYEYVADDNGNALQIKKTQLVVEYSINPRKPKYTVTKYKRDIVYAKKRSKKK